jgi:transmembrane sensor
VSAADRNDQSDAAVKIKAQAATWLEQRDRETWSSADQAALNDWLDASMSHRVAFWRLDAAWNRTERLAALRSSVPDIDTRIPARWSRPVLTAAVVLGFIAVTGIAARNYLLRPNEQVYATSLGGRETIALNDGSQIELNTDTELRVDISARGRLVSLDRGEAYFQIKHDAAHPFVVMAGNHRIVDLGTKFLVRRDADRLCVSLMEGRAQFDATDSHIKPVSIELNPGDVIVAENDSVVTTRKSAYALVTELGWRRGVVVFDNTTLADAAAEFNRYSRRKLVIADTASARLKIDGTFQTGNIDAFADAAQDALGLHVGNHLGEVVISR